MTEEATVERTVHDTRSTSRLRRLACATAAVAVLAAVPVIILPQAEATAPAPLFEQIGTLDRFPEDARKLLGEDYVPTWENATIQRGTIGAIMVPELRRLVQLYPSSATGKTGVVVRDLDTLAITRTAVLPFTFEHPTGGDWLHAVDPVGGRLFLVATPEQAVVEVDLHTLAPRIWPLPGKVPVLGNIGVTVQLAVGAVTYDPHRDDLLLLWGGPQVAFANNSTFLQTIDLGGATPKPSPTAADAATQLAGFHQVRSCTAPMTSTDQGDDNYAWEILATEDYLYVPCQRAGHTGIVVRTARPTPGSAQRPTEDTEDVAAGPVYVENAMADQAAGRIVMTTYLDDEIWVFEAATMSFVGIAATAPPKLPTPIHTGYGLDRATGRVFFQSPNFGLGIVEARFFPLPQARTSEPRVEGNERILSDARTNRVFVLEGTWFGGPPKARAYRIYRVPPAPLPPPPPDPDRNTVDLDEQAGTTEARFNAGASGYGTRVVLAKGVVGVPPAPIFGVNAPTSDFFETTANSRCGFTDRELAAGRVFRSEYDTGSAAAEAIALDVDGATKQDLDRPSRCDVVQKGSSSGFKGLFGTAPSQLKLDETTEHTDDDPTKPGNESRWRWQRASCASSEGRPKDASGDTEAEPNTRTVAGLNTETTAGFGPSAVDCPEPGGVLTASATAQLEGSLSVGKAWTETRVSRSSAQGVTATVTSVAQDVRLALPDAGVVVTFAEIRSTATSSSNGRPPEKGKRMSEHRVLIRGARLNGAPLCGAPETDLTKPDPCEDLTGLVDRLNAVAAGRAVFRTGTGTNSGLDGELVEGSDRGAQTAVQKSAARQASDRALTGDFTVEVPGLEVLTFNDNTRWGRARQLYQFAGVASSATYNIVLRPSGLGLPDLGPFEGSFGSLTSNDDSSFGSDIDYEAGDFGEDDAFDTASTAVVDDDDGGGGFWAPLRAVARGLRLFLTDPRHALLLLTAWALLGLPGALSRRRRLLTGVRTG